MLKYRALLVDTEGTYERPVQAFFQQVNNIEPWAKETLRRAIGKDAYVVVYRDTEVELGTYKKSDYYDKGAVSGLQPAGEKTGKPAA